MKLQFFETAIFDELPSDTNVTKYLFCRVR